jgi:hypothetical protein
MGRLGPLFSGVFRNLLSPWLIHFSSDASFPVPVATSEPRIRGAVSTGPNRPPDPGWPTSAALPIGYFHLVFTLPAEIAPIGYQNKAVAYHLLFRTAAAAPSRGYSCLVVVGERSRRGRRGQRWRLCVGRTMSKVSVDDGAPGHDDHVIGPRPR